PCGPRTGSGQAARAVDRGPLPAAARMAQTMIETRTLCIVPPSGGLRTLDESVRRFKAPSARGGPVPRAWTAERNRDITCSDGHIPITDDRSPPRRERKECVGL